MTSKKQINLEQTLPEGQIVNRAWLNMRGFNRARVDYALRAGKLEALSQGIYRRPGPPLKWEHVVYSLKEMGYQIHVGGRSALELQGFAHYLPLSGIQHIHLYSSKNFPAWNLNFPAPFKFKTHTRLLFKEFPEIALTFRPFGTWDWPIPCSMPELALLELLADVKEAADFSMADKFFEGAVNLRPSLVYDILRACGQVKAKRLFLWFSNRHDHAWRQALEIEGIDLGRGKRMLIKRGAYDAAYQITIPKEMVQKNEPSLY